MREADKQHDVAARPAAANDQQVEVADKTDDPSAQLFDLNQDIDFELETESSEAQESMNAKSAEMNTGDLSRPWRHMQRQKRRGVGRLPLSVLGKTSGPTLNRRVPPGFSASGASKRDMVSAEKRSLFSVAEGSGIWFLPRNDPCVFIASGSKLGGGHCRRPKTLPETLPALPTSSHTLADAVPRRSKQQQRITRLFLKRATQTLEFQPVLSSGSCPTARSSFASRPITPMAANLVALAPL
jgi:hypothetical protein